MVVAGDVEQQPGMPVLQPRSLWPVLPAHIVLQVRAYLPVAIYGNRAWVEAEHDPHFSAVGWLHSGDSYPRTYQSRASRARFVNSQRAFGGSGQAVVEPGESAVASAEKRKWNFGAEDICQNPEQ